MDLGKDALRVAVVTNSLFFRFEDVASSFLSWGWRLRKLPEETSVDIRAAALDFPGGYWHNGIVPGSYVAAFTALARLTPP